MPRPSLDAHATGAPAPRAMNWAGAVEEIQAAQAARNERAHAAWAAAPPASRRALRITDWNLGMIRKGGAFSLLSAIRLRPEVPEHPSRQHVFDRTLRRLLEHQPDVAFFQELFHGEDLDTMTRVARASGFLSCSPAQEGSRWNRYGLHTLVRRGVAQGDACTAERVEVFPGLNRVERLVNTHKGMLPTRMTLEDGTRILLISAHFTFSLKDHAARARQVGRFVDYVREHRGSFDHFIAGIDLNASDRMPRDARVLAEGWHRTSAAYCDLMRGLEPFGVSDAFRIAHPDEDGFTVDPVNNVLAARGPSTRDEIAQRLDYILIGTDPASARGHWVSSSRLIMTDDVAPGIPGSDHWGVLAEVHLF